MKNNIFKGLILVVTLVAIDLLIKYLMDTNFSLNEERVIIDGFFSLTYAHNYGAAFSILTGNRVFLILISIIGTGIFGFMLKSINFKNNLLNAIAVCLMLAGTVGNLYDRLFLGYVRDMFDFIIFGYDFAIFNFADMCLVIGVFLFVLDSFEIFKKKGEV